MKMQNYLLVLTGLLPEKVVALLEQLTQLIKIEDLKNNVGYSERTDAVVEKN